MKKTFLLMMAVVGFAFGVNTTALNVDAKGGISMDEAKKIALEKVNGKVLHAKTEEDDGRVYYEIIIQDANKNILEVEIDKATGKVLEVEKEGMDGAGDDSDDGDDDGNGDDDRYDD